MACRHSGVLAGLAALIFIITANTGENAGVPACQTKNRFSDSLEMQLLPNILIF
jgi:hypothetical protein